jgi:hypothetical protein
MLEIPAAKPQYLSHQSFETDSKHAPENPLQPSVRHVSLPPVKLHDEDWDTEYDISLRAPTLTRTAVTQAKRIFKLVGLGPSSRGAVEGQIKRMHDKDSKLSPSIANRDSAISNGGRRLSGMILDLPSMIVAPNTDSVYRAAISDYRYRTAVSRWTAHAMASNINLECPNLSPGFCSCCPTSTQHDVSIRKSLGNDAQM